MVDQSSGTAGRAWYLKNIITYMYKSFIHILLYCLYLKKGTDGLDGVDGRDGKDGKDGTPGPTGPPGTKGDPGKMSKIIFKKIFE